MLHRDNNNINSFLTAEYWQSINPQLNKGVTLSNDLDKQFPNLDNKKKYYNTYGFVGLEIETLEKQYQDMIDRLHQGVENLVEQGWPAIFIYMYDEPYELIRYWNSTLQKVNSNSTFLGDIYAWKTNKVGWGPHRDRMASDSRSFREDGSAMLSTTWLPLTNVHTKMSCMNFIPAPYDPNYHRGDGGQDTLGDIFLPEKGGSIQNYQRIRPMPLSKGSTLHFTHRVIHWGSAIDPEEGETPNRIAMSWVMGDTRFEEPAVLDQSKLFTTGVTTEHVTTPVKTRVAFISAQVINYAGQTGITKHEKSLYWRLFSMNKSDFSLSFIGKVETLYSVYSMKNSKPSLVIKEKPCDTYNLLEEMNLDSLFDSSHY